MRKLVAASALLLAGLLAYTGQALGVLIVQGEPNLAFSANVSPTNLPRSGRSPIALYLNEGLRAQAAVGDPEPRRMWLEIGSGLSLDFHGLPTCNGELWELSTAKLRRVCRRGIVGTGSAMVVSESGEHLPEPLTVVNLGLRGQGANRADYLELHFPIPQYPPVTREMKVRRIDGRYGLRMAFGGVLGSWGGGNFVQGLDFTLFRRFTAGGLRHSFVNGSCSKGGVPMRIALEYLGGAVEHQSPTLPCTPTGRTRPTS